MSKEPKVFDAKIEELMQLALKEPQGESNIVGMGAMWLAAELFYLQEVQERELRKKSNEATQRDGDLPLR